MHPYHLSKTLIPVPRLPEQPTPLSPFTQPIENIPGDNGYR